MNTWPIDVLPVAAVVAGAPGAVVVAGAADVLDVTPRWGVPDELHAATSIAAAAPTITALRARTAEDPTGPRPGPTRAIRPRAPRSPPPGPRMGPPVL